MPIGDKNLPAHNQPTDKLYSDAGALLNTDESKKNPEFGIKSVNFLSVSERHPQTQTDARTYKTNETIEEAKVLSHIVSNRKMLNKL